MRPATWKRIGISKIALALALLIVPHERSSAAEDAASTLNPTELTAESAVLIDAASGAVLFGKDPDRQMYPASITKIVTGIVALEDADLGDIVTVSKTARGEEGTRVYLAEGEQVTMEKLLYGLLMNSGNDAATAIAEHIDGSKDAFARRMNDFVKKRVGVQHTHFVNPSGLPDPQHVTTAKDMAAIARYAMRNETFRTIVSTRTLPWKGKEWETNLVNHNKMLGSYEGTTGIKNGYTVAAGNTLVASASRGGMELIGVVLKSSSSNNMYADMTRMLDYGFANFEHRTLLTANEKYEVNADGIQKSYVARASVVSAVPKGQTPVFSVSRDGEVVLSTPLGSQIVARLDAIPQPQRAQMAETEVAAAAGEEAKASGSVFENLVFAFWLLLNAFIAFIGSLLYRKRRRKLAAGR